VNYAPYIFGIVGVLGSLIGVIYHNLTNRLTDLETRFGNAKSVWNGKTPTIIASATRLDDMEKRMDRLEKSLTDWMIRMESKLDALAAGDRK
jgi:hypothetical protein